MSGAPGIPGSARPSARQACLAGAFLLLAAPAAAQDLRPEPIPPAFRDLARSPEAVILPLDGEDEDGVAVELQFDFPFGGVTRTQVTVTTNGYLTFGNAVVPLNEPIPSDFAPGTVIAPFWDDLDLRASPDARVLMERRGEPGQRTFTAQWDGVPRKQDPAARLTFQVVLFEATGEIQFHYGPLRNGDGSPGGPASGGSATVGIEHPAADGPRGVELAFDEAGAVSPDVAWAFVSGPALPPGRLLGDLDDDGRITVLDQSRLVELGNPHYPPATTAELLLCDVHPVATPATPAGGNPGGGPGVALADRDQISRVIVELASPDPTLAELAEALRFDTPTAA